MPSTWSQARPNYRIGLGLAILLSALLAPWPWLGLILVILTAELLRRFFAVSWTRFLRCYRIPLIYLILSVITVAFEYGNFPPTENLLFAWGSGRGLFMTKTGGVEALLLTTRILSALASLFFIRLSCSMVDFMQGLKSWHLPEGILTLMELIYRLTFTLHHNLQTKIDSQHQRLGYVGLRRGLRSLGLALGSGFSAALKKSERMGRALELRLYQGSLQTLPKLYPNSGPAEKQIKLALILLLIFTGLAQAAKYMLWF
ncbi:MAG: CbiQ family ECF transporter T component [Eubacteriales bacterium]|nr:CbiQ family ECF transporter T component [Eubacteriales bacterium]